MTADTETPDCPRIRLRRTSPTAPGLPESGPVRLEMGVARNGMIYWEDVPIVEHDALMVEVA